VATAGLLAGACAWDLTSSPVNLAVALGAVVVLGVVSWRGGTGAHWRVDDRGVGFAVVAIVVSATVGAVIRPPVKDVAEGRLFWAGLAALAVASVLTCVVWLRSGATWDRGARLGPVAPVAAVAAVAGLAAVVAGSRRPRIDVWVLLQDGAQGFLAGRNPYTMTFPGAPRGQTTECFTYLPGSFLLGAPGRLAGDVRWAELAVLLIGWAALAAAVRHRAARHADAASQRVPMLLAPVLAMVAFALAMPATVRVVQQSWTDSLLVGLVLVAVALVVRGRLWWAMLPFAIALATKQHVVLLLPLILIWWGWRRCLTVIAGAVAICAPWVLAAPGRMWTCGATFFLDLPATDDSISYWRFLPGPARLPLVLALTVGALWLCHRRLPRTPAAFLLGAATVNAAFDLANKQSYLNQWWFVAQLVLAAVVVTVVAPDRLCGVTTGAGTGSVEPGRGTPRPSDRTGTPGTGRRRLLRLAGAGAVSLAVAGCSLVRSIGGPGSATDPATPTNRPTVLATAVPLLGVADAATVAAAVQLVVGATGGLSALASTRPDLRSRLVSAATAHEAHLRALAALTGDPVPKHPTIAPSGTPRASATAPAGSAKPTTTSLLTSAASIEQTLADAVTTRTAQAIDTDVATLLASVAASATGWQDWFRAAAAAERPTGGG
jgi:hypothetical protein